MPADHLGDRIDAIETDHEPHLEGSEPTSEGNLPIPVVDHRTGRGLGGTQVLGENRQGVEEGQSVASTQKNEQSKPDSHPLVGVGDVAVGQFHAVD